MRHKSFFRSISPSISSTKLSSVVTPKMKSYVISGVTTAALEEQIEKANSFGDFWDQVKNKIIHQPLSEYLRVLLKKKGLKRSDIVVRTGLDKAYVYQIFAGKKNPSRNKLITIAFGMRLNEKETQRMLNLSRHRALWPKDERDALILFAIRRGLSLEEVHTELEYYGLTPLVDPTK